MVFGSWGSTLPGALCVERPSLPGDIIVLQQGLREGGALGLAESISSLDSPHLLLGPSAYGAAVITAPFCSCL